MTYAELGGIAKYISVGNKQNEMHKKPTGDYYKYTVKNCCLEENQVLSVRKWDLYNFKK